MISAAGWLTCLLAMNRMIAAALGLGSHARWLAWLNLVVGCGFLALTAVTLLPASELAARRHRRHVHAHA